MGDEGMAGEAQELANKAVDAAQALANGAVDLAEEAAGDALALALQAQKALAEAVEKLANLVLGK